jgi:hypothetical protein
LFSIGVHDIPLLEDESQIRSSFFPDFSKLDEENQDSAGSWIACTTDGILEMKTNLYDVLITLPSSHSADAPERIWPKVERIKDKIKSPILATQRDLKRYRALRSALRRVNTSRPTSRGGGRDDTSSTRRFPEFTDPSSEAGDDLPQTSDEQDEMVVERVSWPELAYTSFMWWASAGEQQDSFLSRQEEADEDETIPLLSLFGNWNKSKGRSSDSDGGSDEDEDDADRTTAIDMENSTSSLPRRRINRHSIYRRRSTSTGPLNTEPALDVVTYFHRLTTRFFTILASVLDHQQELDSSSIVNNEQQILPNKVGDDLEALYISTQDMQRLGLDVWSANDHEFLTGMCKRWFGRDVKLEKPGVDLCGWSIC